MECYNVIPNLGFLFHLDTLKFSKAVLLNIHVTSNFKLKTIFEFFIEKSMGDSGLESHRYFSDLKATSVILKCDSLWIKRHN